MCLKAVVSEKLPIDVLNIVDDMLHELYLEDHKYDMIPVLYEIEGHKNVVLIDGDLPCLNCYAYGCFGCDHTDDEWYDMTFEEYVDECLEYNADEHIQLFGNERHGYIRWQ